MAADLDSAADAALTEAAGAPNPQVSDEPAADRRTLALVGRVYLPMLVIAGCAAWLAWYGWTVLSDYRPARSIPTDQFEQAGGRPRLVRTFLTQWAEPCKTNTNEVSEP